MKQLLAVLVLSFLGLGPLQAAPAKKAPAPAAVVDVYYFHGFQRCMSCNKIEAYTKETVEKRFAADVKKGGVVMHVINLEAPENQHYAKDFNINAKTVVVTRSVGGRQVSHRTLDQVWMLLRDKPKFLAYVEKSVNAAKKGA
jgi:hypothetical protein